MKLEQNPAFQRANEILERVCTQLLATGRAGVADQINQAKSLFNANLLALEELFSRVDKGGPVDDKWTDPDTGEERVTPRPAPHKRPPPMAKPASGVPVSGMTEQQQRREETIDRLWENSNHGTRREDIEAAFVAGLKSKQGDVLSPFKGFRNTDISMVNIPLSRTSPPPQPASGNLIAQRNNAAVRTLIFLGYEWLGGEQWKPPLGKPANVLDWQPIETAPKTGKILVKNESGWWVATWNPIFVSGYRPENPWQSMMLNHDGIGFGRPTHWRPLP